MEADALTRYEVKELKRWRDDTEAWRRLVDSDRRDLAFLRSDVTELTLAVNALRKMLLTFALSVAGSAVVFALTVLISTGKIHG